MLVQSKSKEVQSNAVKCLHMCIEEGDEEVREQFAESLWLMLPGVLSEALIDYECQTGECVLGISSFFLQSNHRDLVELESKQIINKHDNISIDV